MFRLPITTTIILSLFFSFNILAVEKTESKKNISVSTSSSIEQVRGKTKNEIRQQFGSPVKQIIAVGSPPISRWIYPDFTIYFDKNYAIHAVKSNTNVNKNSK